MRKLSLSSAVFRHLMLAFVVVLTLSGALSAQTASALKAKRQRLEQELQQTSRRLAATRSRRGAAIGQADLLRQQIEQRRALLATLQEESDRLAVRLRRDSSVVVALTDDLERMRTEYGAALRAAYRARLSRGWLIFLLRADGFNDAFRRAVYLRQYRQYRSRQALAIHQTRTALHDRLSRLEDQRATQDSLLFAVLDQDATLREELDIQTQIVRQLSGTEKVLLGKIREQEQQQRQLQNAIRKAISRTIAAEARRENTARSSGKLAPAAAPPGSNIAQRRGRLGWPVRGRIRRPFGLHPHPEVPSVKVNNNGVDIAVASSSSVVAVFAGQVINQREIPGMGKVVMLRHGEYYSVYSGLAFTEVTTGQQVQAGDQLGLMGAADPLFHFELWQGKAPLDPELWLRAN